MPARWRPMMRGRCRAGRGRVAGRTAQRPVVAQFAGGPWLEQSSSWLFLACMSVALVALHFVLVAPFANPLDDAAAPLRDRRRQRRGGLLHAYLRGAHGPHHDAQRARDRHARSPRADLVDHGRLGAARVGVAAGIHLVGAYRAPALAACAGCARREHGRRAGAGVPRRAARESRCHFDDAQPPRAALSGDSGQSDLGAGRQFGRHGA